MLQGVCEFIWGVPLLTLILGSGVYLTIRLRAVQFRYLGFAFRMLFSRHSKHAKGEITPFQALMTALASMIGIGNIAGVATAVVIGGVGSLFWMVVAAFVGMATSFAESFLAVKYRSHEGTEVCGGPMYFISKGLGWKKLAAVFAAGGAVATLTTGNMVQSNAIADCLAGPFPQSRFAVGGLCAIAAGLVLFGGIRKLGKVVGVLVPVMAGFYFIGAVVILTLRAGEIPGALEAIFASALKPGAAAGGILGGTIMAAMRMGVSRGLFASEGGLGSSSIAAAAAKTDGPGQQALVAITGSFISVCVVCTITGLVLTVTGVAQTSSANGVLLTIEAFNSVIPFGGGIVIGGAILFGFSTILGWAYYGEKCSEYLLGPRAIGPYRVVYLIALLLGAVMRLDLVWCLADCANIFMVVPNLIGVLALSPIVVKETRPFLATLRV